MFLDIPYILISELKALYKIIIDRFFLSYKKKAKNFFKKKNYLKYFFA